MTPERFEDLAAELDVYARTLAHTFYAPGLDRDDIHQIALIAMWDAWQTHDPARGSVQVFAKVVMRRTVITEVIGARRKKRFSETTPLSLDHVLAPDGDGATAADVIESEEAGPFERLAQREQLDAVLHVVNEKMTPLEREVAVGLMNGEAYHEIGVRLGFHVYERSNGKTRCKRIDNALQRGRRKVASALMDLEAAA